MLATVDDPLRENLQALAIQVVVTLLVSLSTLAAPRLRRALPVRVTTRDRTVSRPRQEYLRRMCLAGPNE